MKRITIHRALAELKTIDARIEKEIASFYPLGIHQKDKNVIIPTDRGNMGLSKEDHEKVATSSWQAITSLLKNKAALKKAIVESNAKTLVNIGAKIYTVAEAITEKSYILKNKQLVDRMSRMNNVVTAALNQNNDKVEKGKEELLKTALAGKQNHSEEDVKNISGPYMEMNTWYLHNPLQLDEKLKIMSKEIIDFETEVDAVLSESNAITYIEIEE